MKNLIIRSVSGLIYVALIVGALFAGELWTTVLFGVFSAIGMVEFYRIAGNIKGHITVTILDILGGMFLFSIMAMAFEDCVYTDFAIAIYGLYIITRIVIQVFSQDFDPIKRLSSSLFGHIYIVLPLGLLTGLYSSSPALALMLFIMIWLNDTGAYLVGVSLGKHRLFPRVSPKKSWEGLFGGIFFTIAIAIILAMYTPRVTPFYTIPEFIVLGLTVSLAATFGDLIESAFKRSAGVKDSGKIIPGHGGILDRIDSLLLVVPSVMLLLYISHIF